MDKDTLLEELAFVDRAAVALFAVMLERSPAVPTDDSQATSARWAYTQAMVLAVERRRARAELLLHAQARSDDRENQEGSTH